MLDLVEEGVAFLDELLELILIIVKVVPVAFLESVKIPSCLF